MGLWAQIIAQTSTSPLKLLAFGGLCIAASAGLGSIFTQMMSPAPTAQAPRAMQRQGMSYEDRRMVSGREQRLSVMIKDIVEGQGDEHWSAAMRGTVVRHPGQEIKTEGLQRAALARAAEAAAASETPKRSRGWWG